MEQAGAHPWCHVTNDQLIVGAFLDRWTTVIASSLPSPFVGRLGCGAGVTAPHPVATGVSAQAEVLLLPEVAPGPSPSPSPWPPPPWVTLNELSKWTSTWLPSDLVTVTS